MTEARALRMLLVEDNPDHVELIRRSLERVAPDAELRHVRDGEQALDYLFHRGAYADAEAHPAPDLMLLDLNLPRVHGLQVLQLAKSAADTAHIPVVVLSSSDAQSDVRAAYARAANSYLVKPMSFRELTSLMAATTEYWRRNARVTAQTDPSPSSRFT